jgi:type VI secretion system secreted protein Hcp
MKRFVLALFAIVCATAAFSAQAQYASCKIVGQRQGVIKGDVTTKGQEDQIAALSFTGGLKAPFDAASGLATGKRQYSPLLLVKNLDKASPLLFLAAVTNENLTEVTCTFYRNTSAGTLQPFYSVKLSTARIVSLDFGGNAQVNLGLRETVGFVFRQIEVTDLINHTTESDDWESPNS